MAAPTAELIKGRRLRDLAAADLALTGIKEDVDMDLGGDASCGERARGEAEGATHERRGGGHVVGPAGWRRGEGGADEEVGEEEMEALLEAEAAASRAQVGGPISSARKG